VRHANLVPIRALYVGPRGEKLLVHPFYAAGSLRRFLQGLCALRAVICVRAKLASSKASHAK
jgi:hypothetical protein